jgi:NO-binding membrane sensor protein with MHYT domain
MAGRGWAALGGAFAGGGIAAMHYTGMAAMRVAAEVAYDRPMVAMSVAIGVGLGACAFHVREHRPGLLGEACAAVVFALAIVGMHFTAMSALTLAPDIATEIPDQLTSPEWLAVAVTAVTLMIIVLSLAGSVMDQHLAERRAREAERLRRSVV